MKYLLLIGILFTPSALRADSKSAAEGVAALDREDASARAAYRAKNGTRYHPIDKGKKYAKLLDECPSRTKACVTEVVALSPLGAAPLGANLIPHRAYVSVKSGNKTIKLELEELEGEPSCSGSYVYKKLAWVGGNTFLTSAGPVSAAEVFKEFRLLKDYQDPSFSSLIQVAGGEKILLRRGGAEIEPQSYFVKDGRLAKKEGKRCVEIGKVFRAADWCDDQHGFSKDGEKSEDKEAMSRKSIFHSADKKYELVVSFSPAC